MIARKVLHLAAAATTATVATCFASRGLGGSFTRSTNLPLSLSPKAPPTEVTARTVATQGERSSSGRRSSSLRCATTSTQAESLRTRGGGSLGSDGAGKALQGGGDLCAGAADKGLAETDPEVWEIISAERRRQVGVAGVRVGCISCQRWLLLLWWPFQNLVIPTPMCNTQYLCCGSFEYGWCLSVWNTTFNIAPRRKAPATVSGLGKDRYSQYNEFNLYADTPRVSNAHSCPYII